MISKYILLLLFLKIDFVLTNSADPDFIWFSLFAIVPIEGFPALKGLISLNIMRKPKSQLDEISFDCEQGMIEFFHPQMRFTAVQILIEKT